MVDQVGVIEKTFQTNLKPLIYKKIVSEIHEVFVSIPYLASSPVTVTCGSQTVPQKQTNKGNYVITYYIYDMQILIALHT